MTHDVSATPLDALVVGLGAVGSAALLSLARAGARVVGVDPRPPAHDRGSSHGHTRIFRHAYFEHPDYVPLLRAAVDGFGSWEQASGTDLLVRCGVLVMGPAGSEAVVGSLRSAQEHGLTVEALDAAALRSRFPQFLVNDTTVGIFEPDAGFVRVEGAIRCALSLATAPRRHGVGMRGWQRHGPDRLTVDLTDGSTVHTRRLVVAAGAWTPDLLPELAPLLTVTRQVQAWVTPDTRGAAHPHRLPGWLIDRPGQRPIYGIPTDPARPGPALAKVAVHGSDRVTTPSSVDRTVHDAERDILAAHLRDRVPGLVGPVHEASVCLYTSTPDEHFLVDRLPEAPEVVFAAGLSGHGFKMAPALGHALADLALLGRSDLPVGFLGLDRLR